MALVAESRAVAGLGVTVWSRITAGPWMRRSPARSARCVPGSLSQRRKSSSTFICRQGRRGDGGGFRGAMANAGSAPGRMDSRFPASKRPPLTLGPGLPSRSDGVTGATAGFKNTGQYRRGVEASQSATGKIRKTGVKRLQRRRRWLLGMEDLGERSEPGQTDVLGNPRWTRPMLPLRGTLS